MKFKDMKLRYKVGVGVVTGASIVGMAGGAFAYFTGSGSGNGTASVGSTATWTVAQSGSASGAMYPGAGTSTVTFTATNSGTGYQGIDGASQLTVSINAAQSGANAGDITVGGTAVAGCLASWFTPTLGTPTPAYGTTVAPTTGTYSIPVNVTMSNAVDGSGNGINQDACKGATPEVHLAVAHS